MEAIVSFIFTFLAKVVEQIKSTKALMSVAIGVAVLLLFGLGYFLRPYLPLPGPTPSLSGRGVDLAKYCESYGYKSNSDDHCYSKIDLDQACNWEYKRTDMHIVLSGGLKSGRCYDAKGKFYGGINRMTEYCREQLPDIPVEAAIRDKKEWVCQTKIDFALVCKWQYMSDDMEARKIGDIWLCFDA